MRGLFSKIKKIIFRWVLPPGLADFCRMMRATNFRAWFLVGANSRLKDIHRKERCFIVCNGPSINKQNLLLLKNEIVFSVSSGYHHKDYLTIQPKYHCLPPYNYYKDLTYEDSIAWFREMDTKLGAAELFIGITQESLIRKNKLFKNRKVNYIYTTGLLPDERETEIEDISKRIHAIKTVPIMCLLIAMYMGFKEIYLLGVENDWWRNGGEYKYFFEPTVLKGKGDSTDETGKLKYPQSLLYMQFAGFGELLKEFLIVHNRAKAHNIHIYNATEGGALEEFPRVKFESLFLKNKRL